MKNIAITRGDSRNIKFNIKSKDGSSYVMQEEDKLYFTVKKDTFEKDYILQKTFNNGITYDGQLEKYTISLVPEDTDNLSYGTYVYDIEIIVNSNPKITKTMTKGKFIIEEEVTYKENE